MRSCARRSREAATIFIAFVICCVDLTARTRRRMSKSEGISYCSSPRALRRGGLARGGERLAELLQGLIEIRLDRIAQLLLGRERREELRAARVEELVQVRLVGAHVLDRHGVEITVRRRVDDDDLLLDRERLVLRLLQHFHE